MFESGQKNQESNNQVTEWLQTSRRFWRQLFVMALTFSITTVTAVEVPADVPLFDDGSLVRVPVKAHDQVLNFILDTGCTCSAIDSRFQEFLGTPINTLEGENPLGSRTFIPVYACPELTIGERPVQLAQITSQNLTMPRMVSGQSCDGILGMDFFSKNVVAIDFDQKKCSLLDQVPEAVKTNYVEIRLKSYDQQGMVSVLANHGTTLNLVIDSGDNSSLSLNHADWDAIFSNGNSNQISTALAGLSGPVVSTRIGIVSQMGLGSLDYTNLHATLIPNAADASHLGLGFLRRHQVVFDFPNSRMYLLPGRRFGKIDQEDMSGLHLLRAKGKTFVYSVDPNSPAATAGIQPYDVLTKINDQAASALNMQDIRRILRAKDGSKVVLTGQRGDRQIIFDLTLHKAI